MVLAASSLTDSFETIARDLEAEDPALEITTSFAGSQVLRLQVEHGARADVIASADPAHLDELARAGLVGPVERFASNDLVVIVPRDNPAGIRSFEDLPRAERIVIGEASVPVGAYTRSMLARAGDVRGAAFADAVMARVVSEESNVRLVRAKVELGEADAAIVYRTDAVGSDRVSTVAIPASLNVRADYAVAVVSGSTNPELAARFVERLHSEAGQRALAAEGFTTSL